MNNVVREDEQDELLSLQPLDGTTTGPLASPQITLGGEQGSIVTLEEAGGGGESLLLCSVKREAHRQMGGGNGEGESGSPASHLPSTATITYLDALDGGVNIMLHSLEDPTHTPEAPHLPMSGKDNSVPQEVTGGQFVVVGEAGSGQPMTYIYIQGEADGERVGGGEDIGEETSGEGHTITLNSVEGSELHTLPTNYTQHLQHTYGDLVLVGTAGGSADQIELGEDETPNKGEAQQDDSVLLLSVRPLKLEVDNQAKLPASEEPKETEGKGGPEQSQQEDTDSATIEERLATRDSLLPPRRTRRCGSPGRLTCPVCHTQFRSGRQYHGHLQVHRGQGVWSCEVCNHTCHSAVELRVHKAEAHHAPRPFPCPSCHLSFSKSLVLEDHIRMVHKKERPHGCTFCSKAFYRPHDLKMHLNLHLGIKTNVCHVCGRQFSHPSNLIRHQRLHTGIKPYVCTFCGKRFKQVTLLHKHRATHQPGSGVCHLCPATFRSAAGLRKHSRMEHKKVMTVQEAARIIRGQAGGTGRSYYCRVCGAQFCLKSELKSHEQKVHSNTSQHMCASCGKVYPMTEIKTHACLTPEEQAGDTLALNTGRTMMNSISNNVNVNINLTAVPPLSPSHPAGGQENPQVVSVVEKDEKDEEEEYLVMYITQEGESVSYVMKKGNKASRDQVLQMDAPGHPLAIEENFRTTLPEETIMINVHSNHDDGSLLHFSQSSDSQPSYTLPYSTSSTTLSLPGTTSTSLSLTGANPTTTLSVSDSTPTSLPLPVHSIKLEPQGTADMMLDPDDPTGLPDKDLIPLLVLTAATPKTEQGQQSAPLKPLAIKNERVDLEIKPDISGVRENASGQLVCPDCNKSFSKQWNFQQHMATHDPSLHKYSCHVCNMTFAYRSTLNKHIIKHNPSPVLHQCTQCSKSYQNVTSLKQHHKRDHQQLRPYACNLCTKKFFSKSDYNYHMRLHNKEQPYMCFACGREFSHVSHLHRHERVHTGERPHKCKYCSKTFIQYVTLKIHLKKHEKLEVGDLSTSDQKFVPGVMEGDDLGANTLTCGDPGLDASDLVSKEAGTLDIHGARLRDAEIGTLDLQGTRLRVAEVGTLAIHDTDRGIRLRDAKVGTEALIVHNADSVMRLRNVGIGTETLTLHGTGSNIRLRDAKVGPESLELHSTSSDIRLRDAGIGPDTLHIHNTDSGIRLRNSEVGPSDMRELRDAGIQPDTLDLHSTDSGIRLREVETSSIDSNIQFRDTEIGPETLDLNATNSTIRLRAHEISPETLNLHNTNSNIQLRDGGIGSETLDLHGTNPGIRLREVGGSNIEGDLVEDSLPTGTIILSEEDLAEAQGAEQFPGEHSGVVTSMDGCLAIFVQDNLN